MDYIIYDLELNSKPFKSNLPNEIIEIGAVKLDSNLNEIDTFQAFIKPKYFKKLFPVVKRKTNITQEAINDAGNFKEVISNFRSWIGDNFILISWGHDDIHHLLTSCKGNKITTSWLKKNIDLQKQVSSIYQVPPGQRYSLENALNVLGIEVDEDLHRALADARYTAQIFQKTFDKLDLSVFNSIDSRKKVKTFPKLKSTKKVKVEVMSSDENKPKTI